MISKRKYVLLLLILLLIYKSKGLTIAMMKNTRKIQTYPIPDVSANEELIVFMEK